MDCPICNKIHQLERRKRISQGIVKDETIDYEEIYFLCTETTEEENEFVSASLMDENLLRARDAYRKKKGLLTSSEIAEIRLFYGLTQSDFSLLLGWGEITVTRYESKNIQDETYDNIMLMAYQNPMFTFECLNKHKVLFKPDKYTKISNRLIKIIEDNGNKYLKEQEIKSLYVIYTDACEDNGFKLLDINKITNIIGYYANSINNLYKVKLMKLLWYTDTLFFNRHGIAMTGLVYKHKPLGALPIGHNEIISLPTLNVVEEMINFDICYKICSDKAIDPSIFSAEELDILKTLVSKFKNFSGKDIVDYMHKETAYINTKADDIIKFSPTYKLNELI